MHAAIVNVWAAKTVFISRRTSTEWFERNPLSGTGGVKKSVVAAVCDRRILFISTTWSALIERRYNFFTLQGRDWQVSVTASWKRL